MKKIVTILIAAGLLALSSPLKAGPTSLFWTNCTTDIVDLGKANLQIADFVSVINEKDRSLLIPTDYGFTLGIYEWGDWKSEVGVDYFGNFANAFFFNAKIGIDEDKLFSGAPAFNVGIFNVGTRFSGHSRTNQNVLDVIFGKSLPDPMGGRIFFELYSGGSALGKNRQGFMAGYQRFFCKATDCHGVDYYKWIFLADYASGKNTLGGGGVAVVYCFTPNIFLETGPVWFNDAHIYGKWKWSVQVDFLITVF